MVNSGFGKIFTREKCFVCAYFYLEMDINITPKSRRWIAYYWKSVFPCENHYNDRASIMRSFDSKMFSMMTIFLCVSRHESWCVRRRAFPPWCTHEGCPLDSGLKSSLDGTMSPSSDLWPDSLTSHCCSRSDQARKQFSVATALLTLTCCQQCHVPYTLDNVTTSQSFWSLISYILWTDSKNLVD